MSGIYIHGMKMPEAGDCFIVYPDGEVWSSWKSIGIVGTAIELPHHGRLGDLDALVKKSYEIKSSVGRYSRVVHIEDVKNAETILPADPNGSTDK